MDYEKNDVSDIMVDYERIYQNKNDTMLIKILKFLQGKKNIIQGIIATTSAFLAFKGVISPEDATYINAISLLIFGSASIASGQMLGDNK